MESPAVLRADDGKGGKRAEAMLVPWVGAAWPLPDDLRERDSYAGRLAFTLGLCKVLCGTTTVVLGLAALVLRATLAGMGAGMWAGMVALLAGVVGMLSSRLPRSYAVFVAFLCWSITSLAASALLAVFATTGLVQDLHADPVPYDDADANSTTFGDEPGDGAEGTASFRAEPLYLSAFPAHRAATVANATLVILAVVDCLLSIACVTLVGSEACCDGASGDYDGWGLDGAERKTRRDRLLHWLHQQHVLSFVQHPVVPHSESERHRDCWVVGTDSSPAFCESCVSRDTLESTITTRSTLGRRTGPPGSAVAQRISGRLGHAVDLQARPCDVEVRY